MPHPNKFKYLKAPTIEQIEAVIKKSGVTITQFERFNHIPEGTIKQIRLGNRNLPVQFWNIIFEPTTNTGTRNGTNTHHKPAIRPVRIKSTGSLSRIVS